MALGQVILGIALVLVLFSAGILARPELRTRGQVLRELMVWVARGFGVGRIPIAPGTFGALLGMFWFAALIASGRAWVFALGVVLGLALSVWFCGVAERLLGRKDPSSVVLDEIAAMPVCFVAWVVLASRNTGLWPGVDRFFSDRNWLLSLGVFAAFRVFDVWKPWPVRQSQVLPGGWGITVDDLLAAIYVNAVALLVNLGKSVLAGN